MNENAAPNWEQYLAEWSTRGYEPHIATTLAKADWSEDMINWQTEEIDRLRTQLMDNEVGSAPETRSLQCPAPGCRNTVMQGCFRGDCPATKETAVGCICRSVASLQARPDCPIHGMKETSSAPNTKGSFGSECNRSSCKNMPATWKHRDLQNRYYCQPCGIWINEQNGELLCAPAPNRRVE